MGSAELVTVADVNGCALCGLPAAKHPVLGLGHLPVTVTTAFVLPSPDLVARRLAARRAGGYEIAETHPVTGEPATHFVRTRCRCGAPAIATLERAPHARCSACVMADVEARS